VVAFVAVILAAVVGVFDTTTLTPTLVAATTDVATTTAVTKLAEDTLTTVTPVTAAAVVAAVTAALNYRKSTKKRNIITNQIQESPFHIH